MRWLLFSSESHMEAENSEKEADNSEKEAENYNSIQIIESDESKR